jgi:chloride channel protein, CIC family
VGMGAVVAAATGAPLTGILLVFEMTGDYAIMLPLMLTVAIATVVARRMEPDNLYSGWLTRKGERIEHGARRDVLAGMRVADVYEPPVAVVLSTEPLTAVLGRLDDTDQDAFPVVDGQGILTGMIRVSDLARLVRDGEPVAGRVAADVVTPTETVTPADSLLLAIRRMGIRGAGLLPVVEPGARRLLGVVSRAHVLTVYGRTSITGSHPVAEGAKD